MGDINYKINLSDGGAIEKLRKLEEQANKTEKAIDALNKKRREEVVDKVAARAAMDAQKQHAIDMKYASDLNFKRMRDADMEAMRKERMAERLVEREMRNAEKLADKKRIAAERQAQRDRDNVERLKTQQIIAMELIGRNLNSFANSGFSLLKRGYSAGKGIMTDLLDRGGELMKNEADLKTILGTGAGAKVFSETRKFVRESPFGTEIYDMVKKLSPAYKSTPEAIIPKIKQLADITGADPEMLGRVVDAYATGANTGEARKKMFNTFAAAGEGMIQQLAESMHISRAAVLRKGRKGEIGMSEIDKVLAKETSAGGTFYERLKRVEETPYGRREELKGTFEDIKADIGKRIMEGSGFKKFMDALANMFKDEAAINKIAEFGGKVFTALAGWIDKANTFIQNGGLDKILNGFMFIIDHIKEIMIVLGSAKLLGWAANFVNSLRLLGMLNIGQGVINAATQLPSYMNPGMVGASSLSNTITRSSVALVAEYALPIIWAYYVTSGILDLFQKNNEYNKYENLKKLEDRKDLNYLDFIKKTTEFGVKSDDYESKDKWAKIFMQGGTKAMDEQAEKSANMLSTGYWDPMAGYKFKGPVKYNSDGKPVKAAATSSSKDLKSDESKVTGSRALNIYINMEALVKGMQITASGIGGTKDSIGALVREEVVQALNEALIEAEGVAASRNR